MAHKVIILGASGYTGAELVRLIASHPNMDITALSADRKAGLAIADVFPHLRHMSLPRLQKIADIHVEQADLVFCALPHATSQAVIRTLPEHVKVGLGILTPIANGMANRMMRQIYKKLRCMV